jgi:hypothetical protein
MNVKVGPIFSTLFVLMLFLIAIALHAWGAKEIREDFGALFLVTTIGAIWLLFLTHAVAWLGVGLRDDAVERRNPAALTALCGMLFSATSLYIGGSSGEGPSYNNNFFSVLLAAGVLVVIWVAYELFARISISISEERNLASGIRFGGFLLACGLILGRAVAGNWHSVNDTVHDLVHDGWPAAALLVVAVVIDLFVRPTRERPFPAWQVCGAFPGILYIAMTVAWLCHLGRWEGMPK